MDIMKKILLVYSPFCTPASPSYSITNLYSFLKNNSFGDAFVLDLNLEFHKLKFPEYQIFFKDMDKWDIHLDRLDNSKNKLDDIKNRWNRWDNYEKQSSVYANLTKETYSGNNKKIVGGIKPEHFDELLKAITDKYPDIVLLA
jgi:hypothetical protein